VAWTCNQVGSYTTITYTLNAKKSGSEVGGLGINEMPIIT
jgi:hypothetical protein